MQRHRDQQRRIGGHQPRHLPTDGLGEGGAATIFQAERNGARDLAISDCGVDAGMVGRVGEALRTECLVAAIIGERTVASGTPGRR